MRKLTEIVTEINQKIAAGISYGDNVYYNISEQHEKDGKSFILTRKEDGTQGQLVVNTNQQNVSFYHRILDEEISEAPFGRGNKVAQFQETTLRLVCYGQRNRIGKDQNNIDNQEFMSEVLRIFNKNTTLTGKETVIVEDQSSVFNVVNEEEFDEQLKKNLRLELITFYIEYKVKRKINCEMTLPIGTHLTGDFNTPPTGFVFANGQELNRKTYVNYFNLITRNVTTSLTSGSNIATVSSVANLSVGMKIEGTTLLPAGTEILGINGTDLTLSNVSSGSIIDANLNYIDALASFGDGSLTFTVPDWSGRVDLTAGNGFVKGGAGGVSAVSLSVNEMPTHTHGSSLQVDVAQTVFDGSANQPTPVGNYLAQTREGMVTLNAYNTDNTGNKLAEQIEEVTGTIENAGNSEPHENLQPYGVVNRIIRVL